MIIKTKLTPTCTQPCGWYWLFLDKFSLMLIAMVSK